MKTAAVILLLIPLIFWGLTGFRWALLMIEFKKVLIWYAVFGTFYFLVV